MQVFLTSPWIPPEWIKAHGHEPRGIWALPGGSSTSASAAGVCAFAQSAQSLADVKPDAAVVYATHCDQLRRAYDAAEFNSTAAPRVFLFNVPVTLNPEISYRMFHSELLRLGQFLTELGGESPTTESLGETIDLYRSARFQLREAALWCTSRAYAQAAAAFHWDGSVMLPDSEQNRPKNACSIALVGGPFPRVCWDLFELIERSGGEVTLNATEPGERGLGAQVAESPAPETADTDLCEHLARTFVDACVDVFQRPNLHLYGWLRVRIQQRRIRGIILWHYVACDLWRAELASLREAFGLPVLLLEAEDTPGISQRMRGRVQAFLETLK